MTEVFSSFHPFCLSGVVKICVTRNSTLSMFLRLARTLRSAEALSSDGQLDGLVCVDLWKLSVCHVSMMISRISMLISM